MKNSQLALLFFVFITTIGYGQSIASPIALKKNSPTNVGDNNEVRTTSSGLFNIYKGASEINVSKDIRNAIFLELNLTELARIISLKSPLLELTVPTSTSSNFKFNLHDAKILSDNFIVTNEKNEKINYTPGLYYQGDVLGYNKSLAAFSMFDNSIMAVFSCNNANYVLGLWKDKSNINNTIYILYKDSDVLYPREFACGFDALPQQIRSSSNDGDPHLQSNQCIKIYFECDYHMFNDMGSSVNVTNFVTGMFNVIQTVFNNETIEVEISQVYVWTTTDPYISGVTSSDLLNSFQATRTTFNGDVAHLLTTRPLSAGGLAYLDILCSPSNAYAMSNIDNTYDPYPNTCWTTMVVAHELGHNFGSNHTQWCGWPGGAIDDCYTTEGGCPGGATPPTGGGTIMSYCHLSNVGILLTNGFGTLPGNAIRASYTAASCLTACASPPAPQFSNTAISSCTAPATVTFIDQTLGAVVSWAWDVDNDGIVDYTTPSPTHTYTALGTYTVKLSATNANGTNTIIKTNYITIGPITPAVTANVSVGSSSTCQSSFVTFTAIPTNGGDNPQYQWYLNGNALPGETSVLFIEKGFSTNDIITCEMVSDALCVSPTNATSNAITMTVDPVLTPAISISITSGSTNICEGESVTYTATSVNGGTTPAYQWRINGVNVGTNSPTFTTSTLSNTDAVTCVLTTSETCVSSPTITSNIIVMTVNADTPPIVTISITSGTNPTCSSDPITFTALSIGGGTLPIYQWKKNGVNTVIGNSYTLTNPANGDIITCTVTSNAPCITANTGQSAPLTISLISSPIPTVSIGVASGTNPSCSGSSITLSATAGNTSAPTYQWLLNDTTISGAQSQTYSSSSLADGSVLSCVISSTAACTETDTSTAITIEIAPLASINFLSDITICGGEVGTTVFSTTPNGAICNWTNSNTTIGLAASGTGDLPSFNAVNNTNAPIAGLINVIPSVSGCAGTPSSYSITVNPTPTITSAGMVLTSSAATTYQWYKDGQLIPGATNQVYNAVIVGDYFVVVDGGGCPSNIIDLGSVGVSELNNDFMFAVYPNPNNGIFFVGFDGLERDNYSLKIINSIGKLVYDETITDFIGIYSKEMNFENLAKGIYFIHLNNSTSKVVKKVIVY